jgi:hypothetical protein
LELLISQVIAVGGKMCASNARVEIRGPVRVSSPAQLMGPCVDGLTIATAIKRARRSFDAGLPAAVVPVQLQDRLSKIAVG